eukprot:gene57933-biopygen21606
MGQLVDFAAWLRARVTAADFVVVKMDVEGAEFALLDRMLGNGALGLVDELFLECHGPAHHPYARADECRRLIARIRA